jgi:phage shock protein A
MALLRRLSQLFKADFHAVLDRIEEPKALLKQAMREMEEALLQSEKTLKRLIREQQQLTQKQGDFEQRLDELNKNLVLCFENTNDALAIPLVKQQLETQQLLKLIIRKQENLAEQLTERHAQHKEQQALYESTRQKAALFIEENQASVSNDNPDNAMFGVNTTGSFISDEEVELALMQQKQLWDKNKSLQS